MTGSRSRRRASADERAMAMSVTSAHRAAIEVVDREVSELSALEHEAVADGTELVALRSSWGDLLRHFSPGRTSATSVSSHGPEDGAP